MRLLRPYGNVCQNCVHGNNEKGKWIKRRFRNLDKRGFWHIFCEKKKKYLRWDAYKHCFKPIKSLSRPIPKSSVL